MGQRVSDKEYNLHVLQGASREAYGHPPNLFERYALDLRDARRELSEAKGMLREARSNRWIPGCVCDQVRLADQPCFPCRIDAFLGGEGE